MKQGKTMRTIPSTRSGRRLAGRRVDGFVLIEVMIALLIFMFGILGLIGLQVSMTRATSDSKARADATYLASEMVGRLWSDMSNIAQYDSSKCSSTAACKEWQAKVAAALPQGSGTVTIDASAVIATIVITWTGPDQLKHTYTTNTAIVPST